MNIKNNKDTPSISKANDLKELNKIRRQLKTFFNQQLEILNTAITDEIGYDFLEGFEKIQSNGMKLINDGLIRAKNIFELEHELEEKSKINKKATSKEINIDVNKDIEEFVDEVSRFFTNLKKALPKLPNAIRENNIKPFLESQDLKSVVKTSKQLLKLLDQNSSLYKTVDQLLGGIEIAIAITNALGVFNKTQGKEQNIQKGNRDIPKVSGKAKSNFKQSSSKGRTQNIYSK